MSHSYRSDSYLPCNFFMNVMIQEADFYSTGCKIECIPMAPTLTFMVLYVFADTVDYSEELRPGNTEIMFLF